ncbi:hypothetical protein [Vibrio cyclitrophicus]|uniref:hypothetical protein n=1 Tax=Vibrio cyclitrophicus TaxID=47951 RepID=UPI0003155A40|nr:hypothetical protein [Vibrio cyclitrophicus]OEF47891.1 hypothetical protein OAC_18465 [Vibrio cyclitrophicus 1F273]
MKYLTLRAWDGGSYHILDSRKQDTFYACGSFKEYELSSFVTDIDGVEVFQNDIVVIVDSEHHEPTYFIVEFNNEAQWIINNHHQNEFYQLCDFDIKVVGNKHENKNLI